MLSGRDDGEGDLLFVIHRLGIEGFAEESPGDVDSPASRGNPAASMVKGGGVFFVDPAADPAFAKVIDARPDEVADDAWVLFGVFLPTPSVDAEGLRADDQAIGVFLQVMFITVEGVVVAWGV